MKLISLKSGWKTYAVVLAGIVLGGVQGLDANGMANVHVPTWIEWILGFLGAGTLRHGIQTQTATVIENVLAAVTAQPAVQAGPVNVNMAGGPSLTADDVAKAVTAAVVGQRGADQAQADKVQTAMDSAAQDAPQTKADALARLRSGT